MNALRKAQARKRTQRADANADSGADSDAAGAAAAEPPPEHGGAAENPASHLRPRGSNHAGMREFNERVVLQAIRLHGSPPKAQIARLTRLTPQTVQIIIARLEADQLVRRLEPQIGRASCRERVYSSV